jgi:ABC-type uncharacterized transport system YnjBCD substrate-binding protein
MSIINEIETYLKSNTYVSGKMKLIADEEYSLIDHKNLNKPWNKLSGIEKLNRLMKYHKVLVDNYQLNAKSSASLKQLFNTKHLDLNDDIVEYDISNAKIINIKGLKKNIDNEEFYIDKTKIRKPIGIKVKIAKFKKP